LLKQNHLKTGLDKYNLTFTLDAVLSVTLKATGVDEIPMSFVRVLLPVILPALTHIYNYIFTCSAVEDLSGVVNPKSFESLEVF
jgi:hypothetical protein